MSEPITPREFENAMKKYSEDWDQEEKHIDADALMCKVLEDLGYKKGVMIFRNMEIWYA